MLFTCLMSKEKRLAVDDGTMDKEQTKEQLSSLPGLPPSSFPEGRTQMWNRVRRWSSWKPCPSSQSWIPGGCWAAPDAWVSGSHPETARTSKSLPKPNNFTGKDPDKKFHLDLGSEWMSQMTCLRGRGCICLPTPLPEGGCLCSPGCRHGPRLPLSLHENTVSSQTYLFILNGGSVLYHMLLWWFDWEMSPIPNVFEYLVP